MRFCLLEQRRHLGEEAEWEREAGPEWPLSLSPKRVGTFKMDVKEEPKETNRPKFYRRHKQGLCFLCDSHICEGLQTVHSRPKGLSLRSPS